jgi:hypothetical protein
MTYLLYWEKKNSRIYEYALFIYHLFIILEKNSRIQQLRRFFIALLVNINRIVNFIRYSSCDFNLWNAKIVFCFERKKTRAYTNMPFLFITYLLYWKKTHAYNNLPFLCISNILYWRRKNHEYNNSPCFYH